VVFEILLKMKRNGWQREIYVKKENRDERYGWHTGILTVLMVVVKEKMSERITQPRLIEHKAGQHGPIKSPESRKIWTRVLSQLEIR
jgi:hypothetical protein